MCILAVIGWGGGTSGGVDLFPPSQCRQMVSGRYQTPTTLEGGPTPYWCWSYDAGAIEDRGGRRKKNRRMDVTGMGRHIKSEAGAGHRGQGMGTLNEAAQGTGVIV